MVLHLVHLSLLLVVIRPVDVKALGLQSVAFTAIEKVADDTRRWDYHDPFECTRAENVYL